MKNRTANSNRLQRVQTVGDARRENQAAKELRLVAIERREIRAKVRRWERKVALYGGAVHIATLAKFQARLASLA